MKLRTFILTIIAHAMNHATRMCWAFNKKEIQQVFQVDQFYLGLADGLFFIMNAIACLFPYAIVKSNNLTLVYMLTTIPFILSFANLGWGSYLFEAFAISPFVKKIILFLSMGSYGFFNFTMWPMPMALVSMHYNSQTQGGWLGFWSSNWQIGNVIGLFLSNFIVHQLLLRWQASIFVIAILNMTFGLAVYFFLQNPKEYLQSKVQTQTDYLIFLKQCTQSRQMIAFFVVCGLISAIFNCILFWLPFYITNIGYASISGYFTIILDVAAIIGAYFIGKSYQKQQQQKNANNQQSSTSSFRQWLISNLFYIVMVVSIMVTLGWIWINTSIMGYGVMTIILGFLFGGMFNSVHSNEIMIYTQNKIQKNIMFIYLISVISSFSTATWQIVLGYFMTNNNNDIKDSQQSSHNNMFYVILVIEIVTLITFYVRNHMKKIQTSNNQQQIKLNNHHNKDYLPITSEI